MNTLGFAKIAANTRTDKKDDYDGNNMSIEEEKNMCKEKHIIGMKKDKSIIIVNVDDLDSDNEPLGKRLA